MPDADAAPVGAEHTGSWGNGSHDPEQSRSLVAIDCKSALDCNDWGGYAYPVLILDLLTLFFPEQ